MSIEDAVKVNTFYTRAVNLERDSDSESVVNAYVPTARAISTLGDVIQSVDSGQTPSAWSLIGPYGSGKSTFAVFLSHVLGCADDSINQHARTKLQESNTKLAKEFSDHIGQSKGYCTILLTGTPEPLSRRVTKALYEKAHQIWSKRRGVQPKFIDELNQLANREQQPTTTEIIDAIRVLRAKLKPLNYRGVLILIDELGKFLEYETRHSDGREIFLLQALAEDTVSDDSVKLAFVVMMHQAFEQYAKGLSEALRNEWSKIQGRFESVPFLESAEQTLRIVSQAIQHDFDAKQAFQLDKKVDEISNALDKAKAIPGTMDADTASALFKQCYPLHPVTALLLPLLCQKVAQNERTLFSYLGSKEAFGFQDSLRKIEDISVWILPSVIYEYFITNQSSVLTDPMTSRRWAEVVTAVERLGDAPIEQIELVKIIGLLNIVGGHGGFKASRSVLEQCFTSPVLKRSLDALQEKSIIQYRKFSSEFRVWQGSDFDIESQLHEELSKIGDIDLADILSKKHQPLPIVARRYSIENGAIRYFVPFFVNENSIKSVSKEAEEARIIYYLSESKSDQASFDELKQNLLSERDLAVLCEGVSGLKAAVTEVNALENIQATSQALASDPVAQHEFKERYKEALTREKRLVETFHRKPQLYIWFWKTEPLQIRKQRDLQYVLSDVLETVYSNAPRIRNELINRDKPSSQASAAKNKLAMAMFHHETEVDLGIEKYPAEKSIYRSLFRESKLHQENDGTWQFVGITSRKAKDDPNHFYPLWSRIEQFLDSTEETPRSFVELNRELFAPPYGIKVGVLSLLYISVLLAEKNELAVYENGVYTPYLAEEKIERFLKRPDTFTVQRFRLTGVNESIHDTYANTLYNDGKERSILALARPIAKMVLDLPFYVQKTTVGLSSRSIALRDAIRLSKSPISLMLEAIPSALDIDLEKAKLNQNEISELSCRLIEALKELKYCLGNLKDQLRSDLARGFGFQDDIVLSKLKNSIAGRCYGLEDYTIDRDGLKAFIQRAQNTKLDDNEWLDELLSFLAQKSIDKWTDSDADAAHYKISEYARKLNELERLRVHYNAQENIDGDFDVYLLRSVKKGDRDYDEVVIVDDAKRTAIEHIKSEMYAKLGTLDDDLKYAVLAEILDESLKVSQSALKDNKAKPGLKTAKG